MKYLNKTFTVGGHSEAYSDGWERIFGTRELEAPEMVTCGCIEEPHYRRPGCVNPTPVNSKPR